MNNGVKRIIMSIPCLGPALRRLYSCLVGRPVINFERSDQYWEDRYSLGGNSGAGSFGRLARFKADFLNSFVKEKGLSTVVEFGCGDGAQLQLSEYPHYIGFDVSKTAIDKCKAKFSDKINYEFHLVGSDQYNNLQPVDITLSIDVIYHLVEDDVFGLYMKKLFSSSEKFVVIYSYDFEQAYSSKHERGRNFSVWVEKYAPEWALIEHIPNKYSYDDSSPDDTSQSQFFVYKKRVKEPKV